MLFDLPVALSSLKVVRLWSDAVAHPGPPTSEEALELAERLRMRLSGMLTSAHVTIGVGRYHAGIIGLAVSFREAEQGVCVCNNLLSKSNKQTNKRLFYFIFLLKFCHTHTKQLIKKIIYILKKHTPQE